MRLYQLDGPRERRAIRRGLRLAEGSKTVHSKGRS